MRTPRLTAAALAVLLAAAPAAALAHGGSYAPPTGGAPSGPQVPPGTADPPSTGLTRWETWWASNKDFYLRLGEEMRRDDGPVSEGIGGRRANAAEAEEQRAKRVAATRDALVPLFVEALGDASFEVRTAAAIALGKTGHADGSRALRKSAEGDDHKDVREAALLGLGLLGNPADIPFLDARLLDAKANTRTRSFAAFSLGLVGGEDAAAALLMFADGKEGRAAAFAGESPELIASVFLAMGLSGDARVRPALRAALASPRYDDTVRAFVVLSLGRAEDRDALPDVGALLAASKDVGLRRSAAIALGRIAKASDEAAMNALVAAAKGDADECVRHFAAISIGRIADERALASLERMFADAEATARTRPFLALALALAKDSQASPAIRAALAEETDESVKSAYCVALGLLRDREAAPLLEKLVADKGRVWLQGYAALGLGLMRSASSAEFLNARLAAESDPRLRANLAVALGLLQDPRAKEYLVQTLRGDGSLYERGGAAMAMGVLRMGAAVPDLTAMYRDTKEQDFVRAFSVVALGLIADTSPVPKLARFSIDNNYGLAISPLNEVLSIL